MKNVMTGAWRDKGEITDKKTGEVRTFDSIRISVQEYNKPLKGGRFTHGLVTQYDFEDYINPEGKVAKRPVRAADISIPIHKFYSLTGIMPQDFLKNFKRLYKDHQLVMSYKEGRFGKELTSIEVSDETYELLQKRLDEESAAYSKDFDETEYEDFDESESDENSELTDKIEIPFTDSSEDGSDELEDVYGDSSESLKNESLGPRKKGLFKR